MLKARFVLSLLFILLLSWADVFFIGTHNRVFIPSFWHQPAHIIALLLTMLTGYLNWKDYPEKWLVSLWILVYSALVAILALAGALYFFHAPYSASFVKAAIYLRNRFTWPLLFIIWYMLHLMGKYIGRGK